MTLSIPASSQADLTSLNTMALACHAKYFVSLSHEAQIEPILKPLVANQAPFLILSGGSNVLLPPTLRAHVIQPLLKGVEVIHEDKDQVLIEVMAGENWHELVTTTVNRGWFGLENLALIPGLTGAAPVQNIGAYGVQLDDVITHVRAYHIPTDSWHHLDKAACEFGYRDSVFKRQAGEWLITRVGFDLHKDNQRINSQYGDVQNAALEIAYKAQRASITPVDIMQAITAIRQSKLPNPANLPNCGSFFKNPIIGTPQFEQLKTQWPDLVGYRVDETHTKVAAGWLIDHAGLKGKGIAPILIHDRQALVLTNHSPSLNLTPAKQSDVAATQVYVQEQIASRYGIHLEREPVWIEEDGQINLSNTTLRG
ncbi:MAG: UDP-N-acetylmuramate dehydrogenase [Psychrobacter sp.]|nr:UDP-N-acetylmuramate dehydrogenase [Psychrobacter sp.]